MNLIRSCKRMILMILGCSLLVPSIGAAVPVVEKWYYSIELLSDSSKASKKVWREVQDQPFARIETYDERHIVRIGFWINKQQAKEQLPRIKKNFPSAFIIQTKFDPDKITQGWFVNVAVNNSVLGRAEPLPLQSKVFIREDYSPPEIITIKERHELQLKRPIVEPGKKPFYFSAHIYSEPSKKQTKKQAKRPDERRLWQLYKSEKYDVLQAELVRIRSIYPNWYPPKKLLDLILQGKNRQKINQAIKENDALSLAYMAELYPENFSCSHIDRAWALADGQARLKQTAALVDGLHQLIRDCDEEDRLATLSKAKSWLDDNQWEKLVDHERKAYRTSHGESEFQEFYYNHQTAKLYQTYQKDDSIAFRTQFLQLSDKIESYQDIDAALIGGWYYYDVQEITEAEVWFNKILAWEPAQKDALRGLSLSALQDKRYSDAQDFAKKLPENSQAKQEILKNIMVSTKTYIPPETMSVALAGGELNPGNSYAYIGAVLPLPNRFSDGFVQRYWADRLTYTFNRNGRKISAEQWGAEALFGYRKFHERGSWAAYVGPVYRNIQFSPDLANISHRGSAIRGKIQLEGEQFLGDNWRINGIASYVTGQDNYWVRTRLLRGINNRFFLGPEAITLGDSNFRIHQLGWVILGTKILPQIDFGVRFGVRKAEGRSASGYLGIEIGRSF